MRIMLRTGIVVLALFGLHSPAFAAEVVDRIVALVDDRIITKVEFEKAFGPMERRIEASRYSIAEKAQLKQKYRKDLLEQMIEEKITDIEVERAAITLSKQEVDQAVERFRQANNLTEDQFIKALGAQGFTLEDYRKKTRDQLLRSRLLNYSVRSKIVITDTDIQEYYDANPQEFGATHRYRMAHILLKDAPSVTGEGEVARKTALMDARKRILAGADFAAEADRISESEIAGPGGELGWFDATSLSPAIRSAVDAVGETGVTEVLETPQGVQLFQVLEKEEKAPAALKSVSDRIADHLYQEEVNRRFREWIEGLREKVHVRILN